MRVLGVDPSSTLCGWAFADNGTLLHIAAWKPENEKDSQESRLFQWYGAIRMATRQWSPDLMVFEQVQSARNMKTVRALARFEAAAIIAAKESGAIALPVAVSSARSITFGKGHGNIPKEDAFEEMKKRYPEFPWLAKTRGGLDQSDAAVIALAGPTVLERR